jgi:hypothetical protein
MMRARNGSDFSTELQQIYPKSDRLLDSFHPESFGRGWAGTSPKPLVICHHLFLGSGRLLASGYFLAFVILP